jgi:carbonic anhydrase/SulP family sulfate permease
VLRCIDSRASAELIFDTGLGDIFNVRIAGNVLSRNVLGSIEYGASVAGAKLVLVIGHTRCGAVTTAVRLACSMDKLEEATGCKHLEGIVQEIRHVIDDSSCQLLDRLSMVEQVALVDQIAKRNVNYVVAQIVEQSPTIRKLLEEKRIAVVGGVYDVGTGKIDLVT